MAGTGLGGSLATGGVTLGLGGGALGGATGLLTDGCLGANEGVKTSNLGPVLPRFFFPPPLFF